MAATIKDIANPALAILARAMILLAFSEFLFLNEGPVIGLLRSGDLWASTVHLLSITGFYLLSGGLLFALEHRITNWASCILVGAFIGWSIEGALVPAVHEAPPFSFLWTSIAWHAPVDVWLGMLILPALASARLTVRGVTMVGVVGVLWGFWASWTWPTLILSAGEFTILALVTVGLLAAGYALLRVTGPSARCGPRLGWSLIGLNLMAALLWASMAPLGAAMLAPLIVLNIVALRAAGSTPAPRRPTAPRLWSTLVYLAVMAGVACVIYDLAASFGLSIGGEDLAALAALAGTLIWVAALVWVARNAWRARKDRARQ